MERLTNKSRQHLLLLHKQAHNKRSIAESLHAYITTARLTVCELGVFSDKYHNSPHSFRRSLSLSPICVLLRLYKILWDYSVVYGRWCEIVSKPFHHIYLELSQSLSFIKLMFQMYFTFILKLSWTTLKLKCKPMYTEHPIWNRMFLSVSLGGLVVWSGMISPH